MEKVKAVVGGSGSVMSLPRPAAFDAPVGALATSAPAPVPTADPRRFDVADPASVLDALASSVRGVHSALLASVDGFGIARSNSMSDEPAHPAMLAAAVGLAHQLAAMGGGQQLRQLVVEHEGGLLVIWPIGGRRVLAVLTAANVDQRGLRTFVQGCATALNGVAA